MKINGREISGPTLEQLLHRLMTYRKYLRLVERRGHVREVIEALLAADAHDRSFFDSREALDQPGALLVAESVASPLTGSARQAPQAPTQQQRRRKPARAKQPTPDRPRIRANSRPKSSGNRSRHCSMVFLARRSHRQCGRPRPPRLDRLGHRQGGGAQGAALAFTYQGEA